MTNDIDPNTAKKTKLRQVNGEHTFKYVALEWYSKKSTAWAESTIIKLWHQSFSRKLMCKCFGIPNIHWFLSYIIGLCLTTNWFWMNAGTTQTTTFYIDKSNNEPIQLLSNIATTPHNVMRTAPRIHDVPAK